MPVFTQGEVQLSYEEHGEGFPILLLAPGGLRSARDFWTRAPFDPRRVLADEFRLIAMDQRNAGASRGPITAGDGWHTYLHDQLALLDHLGIERCHVLGMCIGGPFCLGLMHAAPERIRAGVLLQPIGFADNRAEFFELFDSWAEELRPERPEVDPEDWEGFRASLFGGDFVFNLTREQVRDCNAPMLVLRGDDPYHPAVVSEEVARIAPAAELVREWKSGPALDAAIEVIRQFLHRHS